ncbi:DUF397 domain-containing protein [Streptomyces sp. ID03-2B]|uniref:DUF397 domain-containing protein n=1 Tax=Streptomyces caviscabies TaxID=90079 RepID=A0ABW2MAY6_9ACTN|nr:MULTISPECIES: DUF397 domain-containing protein [Streptomyces]MCX4711405.1 DUF397 domain-containing protein [Streptomyces griseus]MDX2673237.1 DUF397 domain-containing protein [Streptomyces sp. NRRL_ISP-5395]MDX3504463.1 DUF397 domain-containing protein [Streptomyces sp. ATCC51928]MDX3595007.1 DUF397 domain-containing protein [Streptomyces sp. ID03-2B]MDX5519614.1 DUF397 domain-containing protein [Streptomyces sp. DE06-01C]
MTTETTTQQWVKSSYSDNGGTCVEWAPRTASATGIVPVRDSKNPGGPALTVRAAAFTSFVAGVKAGGFDTTA